MCKDHDEIKRIPDERGPNSLKNISNKNNTYIMHEHRKPKCPQENTNIIMN